MNDNDIMDSPDVLTDSDVSVADETTVTEQEEAELTDLEQTDTETEEDVSATEGLTVADTLVSECLFSDVNICNKLDIIIMLLIVMIAIKMFSPLANNHKRVVQKKEK